MVEKYTWIPFYKELATKLLKYKDNRNELVKLIYSFDKTEYLHMEDKSKITDIDPFSFYGIFNRGITEDNRKKTLKKIKEFFQLINEIPYDFDGIPILNNQKSFYFKWDSYEILKQSCNFYWNLFEKVVNRTITQKNIEELANIKGIGLAMTTMPLFWINPDFYLPLDKNTVEYLKRNQIVASEEISSLNYMAMLNKIQTKIQNGEISDKSFTEISFNAWENKTNIYTEKNGEDKMTKAKELANLLEHTHNLILHGAPGTGKTHLAREIAESMGAEVGFVQFHPSYDYTDFVEGLRPVNDAGGGQIGFERKDGVFKKFCERALKNLEDSKKSAEEIENEKSIDEKIESFISSAIDDRKEFKTVTGNKFYITDSNDKNIYISIPANEKVNELVLQRNELVALLNSGEKIEVGNDIRNYFNRKWRTQQDSYTIVLFKEIVNRKNALPMVKTPEMVELKPFIFIIDEINRGEMSKIFGELFFAIEPGYRGAEKCRDLRTQYANLQTIPNLFDVALGIKDSDNFGHFFIPENVYIIGTMNDIDRNVESMDFAFRRRFTFKEIKAKDTQEQILSELDDSIRDEAIQRMDSLNDAISKIEGLSSAYHIGGAYFLKLKDLDNDFSLLWEYHLEGLLREYLRGMEDSESKLEDLKKAYETVAKQNEAPNGQEQ